MKPKHLLSLSVLLISAACSQPEQKPLTQYVDMYIGTGGHGHVFMGANVPFGAVQLGPTSIPQSWDWVSGYHISDTTVIGFSHTHLNGTGIGDLFDVTVMPVVRYCFSPYEIPEKALLHASMIRDFSSISHGSELLHFFSIPGLSRKSPGSSTFRLKSAWHPQNGAL